MTRHQRLVCTLCIVVSFAIACRPIDSFAQSSSNKSKVAELEAEVARLRKENTTLRERLGERTKQSKQSTPFAAEITFADGQKLQISNLRFVYEWYPEKQRQYLNAISSKTLAEDVFHFVEKRRGVITEHSIPFGDIDRIEVMLNIERNQTSGSHYGSARGWTVYLANGTKLVIDGSLTAGSTFLTRDSKDKDIGNFKLSKVFLEGTDESDNKRRAFSSDLTATWSADTDAKLKEMKESLISQIKFVRRTTPDK
ncbi:MAG: hypothetical protein HZA46_13350 [Planctomycetales bacterium]|nr:hypothetical protein [Planctomycetales bacterium]